MLHEELREKLVDEAFTDIIGQDEAKKQLKSALFSGRHVIIEGPPGIGKTTIAKNVAALLKDIEVADCNFRCLPSKPLCHECKAGGTQGTRTLKAQERFVRIQGSPDLTAEDLIGDIDPIKALEFGPSSLEAFTPGKIFRANNGVLFFDEVNRSPEKLQNALLQVLEERKATIGSYAVDIDADFIFIGTMNPQDSNTEQLSEVFLDRFDVVQMTYPETDELERDIVLARGQKLVSFPGDLLEEMVRFVRSFRHHKQVVKAPGVRASIGLYDRAQANAALEGRQEVTAEDVADAVLSVLAHRLELHPSAKFTISPRDFLRDELKRFYEAPSTDASGGYL